MHSPRLIALLPLLALLTACATPGNPRPANLTQISTLDALMAGVYDGETTLAELKRHGDLGLGTFNGLDGEMVVVDGRVYQARSDGAVQEPADEEKTPFAAVTFFARQAPRPLEPGADLAGLQKALDAALPSNNMFYAFRAEGRFRSVRVRSVPRQSQPYRTLPEVAREQREYDLTDVEGVLVGFRGPAFARGWNVPGYHLHFLSKDHRSGGHVLGLVTDQVTVETNAMDELRVLFPHDTAFQGVGLPFDPTGAMTHAVESRPTAPGGR